MPPANETPVPEAVDTARQAGLRYITMSPLPPGIKRLRRGKGFRYASPDGTALNAKADLERIRALAIPPAWTDVWISPSPLGHIQAIGRDAKGRRQYRYHARWREVRDETKYGQLLAFGKMLPAIRRRVRADLARPGVPREKVIAVVVELLDRTNIRVGNEEYARANQSFGLTTLRNRHAKFKPGAVEFRFRGKSGKEHHVRVVDRRIARIVKAVQDIPGQELFQYVDPEGQPQSVDSADVNEYLREISAADVSAKVFRTWAGTVQAIAALRALPPADPAEESKATNKRALVEMVKGVAAQLGNTPAVCRRCYIHPLVVESFEDGTFQARIASAAGRKSRAAGLDADERVALAFLAARKRRV